MTLRLLITGIRGSGGSYLAEYLADKGEVHGIARWHSAPASRAQVPYVSHECDLTDFASVQRTLVKAKPDIVFHLASHANVRASFDTPLAVLDNNIRGTANLLEAIRLVGLEPTVMVCSTPEVYGQPDPNGPPIAEDYPLNPVNPYAVSKLAQDALGYCYFKSYGMKTVRTRMFTYINPRRADLFATSFAMQVARIEVGKQKTLLHGNLDSVRTVLDVRDAVRAYWLAAKMGQPGEVYNIGGDRTMSVGEFLEKLRSLARHPIPAQSDPALMRPVDVALQIPDCRKFKRLTGWEPEIGFDDSVKFLLDHCRAVVGSP